MLKALARSPADLAVDLGTSHCRVFVRGKGLAAEVPSVVATHQGVRGREVVAIGTDARRMLGRTPAGTTVVRPIRSGVVADFEATESLLRHLLKQVGAGGLLRPRVLVCVASDLSEVERRAVQESARAAGSREVFLVATAMAAAIGADLPVRDPVGSIIVDVGGGRTDVAVTSLGGMVVCRSAPIAGDDMDRAVGAWLAAQASLEIGERTAEKLKVQVGSAVVGRRTDRMRTRGRDTVTGTPRELDVHSDQLAAALGPVVDRIRAVVLDALQATPPELAADIVERGLILAGGAAQLDGLDVVLREATGLPVLLAEEPTRCAARGAGRIIDDAALFDRVAAPA